MEVISAKSGDNFDALESTPIYFDRGTKRLAGSEENEGEGANLAAAATQATARQPHPSGLRFAELFAHRAMGPTMQRCLPASALASVRAASGTAWRCLAQLDYLRCLDGREFRVPWPAFPGLKPGLYPHQLASLMAMLRAEQRRGSATAPSTRGGVFADAPGLGKTVTVLALVAHTAGMRPAEPPCPANAAAVQAGWDALRCNPMWRASIVTTLHALHVDLLPKLAYGPARDVCTALLKDAARVVQDDAGRFPTPRSFELHVRGELCRAAALAATAVGSVDGGRGLAGAEAKAALAECAEAFRAPFHDLKASLDLRGRSAAAASGPDAARRRAERRLRPSGATLVAVPDALLEHWAEQVVTGQALGPGLPGHAPSLLVSSFGRSAFNVVRWRVVASRTRLGPRPAATSTFLRSTAGQAEASFTSMGWATSSTSRA
jgi:hypothetical protein